MANTFAPGFLFHPPLPVNVEPAELTSARQPASSADGHTARAQDHLFINKNADSDFASKDRVAKPRGRSAIHSHVQRFRHHQKLTTFSVSRCTVADTSVKHAIPYPPYRSTQRRSQPSTIRTTSSFVDRQSSAITCKSRGAFPDTITSYIALESDAIERIAPELCSNNFLPGDACDPFNSTAVRINQSSHNLVQFFFDVGWKAHLKTFHNNNTHQWSQSFKDLPNIVRGCLYDEMHMNAFLTLNTMRMSFYKVATFDQANSPELLMIKSLRALRMSLSNISTSAVDERTVLDIFFLAFAEFYRQNYNVMGMHLKMIRRLVPLLGGFNSLCQYIREACCFTELCFAIETGQRPVFEMTWDPGPLHNMQWTELKSALESAKDQVLGIGFDDALRDGFFNNEATFIVEELVVDIQAFEFIRKDKHPLPSDTEWACLRNRAYLHRLLSLPRPDRHSSLQQCRIYCVATALLIIFCYECTYVSAVRSGKLVLARLKVFLHFGTSDADQMEYDWGRQNEMLLWIMVVGACVAEGGAQEKWFLDRAILGCRTLNVDSYGGLCDLMSRYIGLGDVQAGSLRRLAGHIVKEVPWQLLDK